jgi:hypothetical protein
MHRRRRAVSRCTCGIVHFDQSSFRRVSQFHILSTLSLCNAKLKRHNCTLPRKAYNASNAILGFTSLIAALVDARMRERDTWSQNRAAFLDSESRRPSDEGFRSASRPACRWRNAKAASCPAALSRPASTC